MNHELGRSRTRCLSGWRFREKLAPRVKIPVKQIFKGWFGSKHSQVAKCSFCGKYHTEVVKLIAGPDCYICDECVFVCSDLLVKECGEDIKSLRDKAVARHRHAIESELRWLKDQHQQGHLSETVYFERQRDLIRPWRKAESETAPNVGPRQPFGNPNASGESPKVT